MSCTTAGCSDWTAWPMPNPASSGLPNAASYDTTVPGVVIDKVTGLWWQQPIDVDNDQGRSCSAGCNQADAVAYCTHLSLGGRCDWRLPTRIELVSIVDYTQWRPAINAVFANTPWNEYRTASQYRPETGPGLAWTVGFYDGVISHSDTTSALSVRCVH